MEKKKRNPNSQKLRILDPSKSWSDLHTDLLNSVCERLGFADFQRAKSVCSTWNSTLRQSMSKLQIPWLILLPNEHNKKYRCTLFNPEEDKLYTTQDLGLQFAMSDCLATYGTWLLMQYPLYRLYIVNPLTKETIYLPPVESQVGKIKIEGTFDDKFHIEVDHEQWEYDNINIKSPVFWIDDMTKDYVVLWGFDKLCVVYAKKGDTSWKQIPGTSNCFGMVYKDHKLYFASSTERVLKIFDLSGEIPQETFQCGVTVSGYELQPDYEINSLRVVGTKLVVTVTGDVLKVEKLSGRNAARRSRIWSFRIYKVYSRGLYKKDEQIDSLGDEAMLFDLGITVPANNNGGFTRNSIYFTISSHHTYPHETNISEIRLFDLDTRKMESVHAFDCLSAEQLKLARWIIPSFNWKCF